MTLEEIKDILDANREISEEEFNEIKDLLYSMGNEFDRTLWSNFIIGFSDYLVNRGRHTDNHSFIDKAYAAYGSNNPRAFTLKMEMLHKLALAQIRKNAKSDANLSARSFLYNSIARLFPSCISGNAEYYSFRNFSDYSLADIKNETISVAHPREFNDPMDTLFNMWLELSIKSNAIEETEKEFRMLLKKAAEHIKMRCMIAAFYKDNEGVISEVKVEDLDSLMWAHYANSHKGFCVRYKFPRTFFCDFDAKEDKNILLMADMNYQNDIRMDLQTIPEIRQALLSKSENWKYERETRLVSYCSVKSADGKPIVETSFPTYECKEAAKAIYLGVKCSDADRRKMEEAIGDKNIELYQMCIDTDNYTKLTSKRIG